MMLIEMKKTDLNKCQKLGILAEVKSIIANCECGEIKKAHLEDISKMRKWELQEYVGNYLDADKYAEDFCLKGKHMKTFCKAFGIKENELAYYYSRFICEGGYEIAYAVTEDIVLVLE